MSELQKIDELQQRLVDFCYTAFLQFSFLSSLFSTSIFGFSREEIREKREKFWALTFSGRCAILSPYRGERRVFAMASFEANCAAVTRFFCSVHGSCLQLQLFFLSPVGATFHIRPRYCANIPGGSKPPSYEVGADMSLLQWEKGDHDSGG